MSEHTPGPWDAYHINDKGLWCVAKMDSGVCIDPSVSNAQLIASAPDLLAYAECEEEAYRPLCDIEAEGFPVMSRYGFRSGTVSTGRPIYAQVIDFLTDMRHAAIAKAEAEE